MRPAGETARRRSAEKRGRSAETLAEIALRLTGYAIMARRFRTKAGEIDLIARRGETIAFVEVKARAADDLAIDAVSAEAQRRIRAAADIWLARQEARGYALSRYGLRFDVVSVRPWRWPKHVKDAF